MGFRYKIPYRYGFFTIIQCALIVSVYILFYTWCDFMRVLPFYFFGMTEIIIATLLILRGEIVRILKFAVIFSSLTFLVLIVAFLLSQVCCTSSVSVWLSVFMGYIVLRCIYVWTLFHLDKKCCIEYDKRQILEQRMAGRDEQPFDRPFMAPTITGVFSESNSIQGSAPSAPQPTPGDSIRLGFDKIAPHAVEKKATDYGWAV